MPNVRWRRPSSRRSSIVPTPAGCGCCGSRSVPRLVSLIFSDGVRSEVNPVLADRRLIELFETAGAHAVRACLSGETRLGYYLDALRTAAGPID
jgi:hypothetical protein